MTTFSKTEINEDYIRGFADGEGCVYFNYCGKYLQKTILIGNTDYDLLKNISNFLNRLKIKHKIYRKKSFICNSWELQITAWDGIIKWDKYIGFNSGDKRKKLKELIKLSEKCEKLKRIKKLPLLKKLLKSNLTYKEIAKKLKVSPSFISRVKHKKIRYASKIKTTLCG